MQLYRAANRERVAEANPDADVGAVIEMLCQVRALPDLGYPTPYWCPVRRGGGKRRGALVLRRRCARTSTAQEFAELPEEESAKYEAMAAEDNQRYEAEVAAEKERKAEAKAAKAAARDAKKAEKDAAKEAKDAAKAEKDAAKVRASACACACASASDGGGAHTVPGCATAAPGADC